MYPISRKKLIAAKLLVIMLFTFFAIVFTNVFVSIIFYLVSLNFDLVQDTLTIAEVQKIASKMVMNADRRSMYEFNPALLWNEKIFRSNDDYFFHLNCRIGLFKSLTVFSLNDIIAIPLSLACIGFIYCLSSNSRDVKGGRD